jgi:hypothetical protein
MPRLKSVPGEALQLGKYRVARAEEDCESFADALLWLVKFYPDLQVERLSEHIEITSPTRSADSIALIWKATLLTEMNRHMSGNQRRQDLAELVR